jgi:hypothetical protein
MNETIVLHLPLDNRTVEIEADLTNEWASPHTGRRLREAESTITVTADISAAFKTALRSAVATDDEGHVWSPEMRSESYVGDGNGPHNVSIVWSEVEELRAERVEFQNLSLVPTRYEESTDPQDEEHKGDATIAITFLATLTADEAAELRKLEADRRDRDRIYWPVLRVGVSDEPRLMRLGNSLWSARDDGNVDYLVVLVDKANDDSDRDGTWKRLAGEPALSLALTALTDLEGRFDALLDRLESGGSIDADARKALDEAGAKGIRERFYRFSEVDNVDEWWLD